MHERYKVAVFYRGKLAYSIGYDGRFGVPDWSDLTAAPRVLSFIASSGCTGVSLCMPIR